MDQHTLTVARELKRRLATQVGSDVRRVIFFGSRVRGEAREDSDLDVAVVVARRSPELISQLDAISYTIMWDFDFAPIISLKVLDQNRYQAALSQGFAFYRNLEQEGVEL